MNKTDYELIQEKLKKEKEENEEQIKILNDRQFYLERTTTSSKIRKSFAIGVFPYLFTIGYLAITASSPNNLAISTFIIAPATVIGCAGSMVVNRCRHVKKNVASFSKAKTKLERKEEDLCYEAEKETRKNKNEIINIITNQLDKNVQLFASIPKTHELKEKQKDPRSIDELKTTIDESKKALTEKEAQLELANKKHVLWSLIGQSRTSRALGMLCNIFTVALGTMELFSVPLLTTSLSITDEVRLFNMIIPFIGGSLVATIYQLKQKHDNKKLFQKMNQELGDDAIQIGKDRSQKNKTSLKQTLQSLLFTNNVQIEENEKQLKQTISEVSAIKYQLEIDQRIYENKQKDNDNHSDGLSPDRQLTQGLVLQIPKEQRAKVLRKQYPR